MTLKLDNGNYLLFQQRTKDVTRAIDETSSVIKALEEVRKDVDATHLAWHEEALLIWQ